MRTQHQTKRELDKIDRNILRILQNDGRISFTELGEKVGLSTTPCTERVRRLEREGIIMGYNARLNPQHLKGSLLVFVEISLDYKSGDTFEEFLLRGLEAAPRAGMPPGVGRLRLPGKSAYFGNGFVPQAARGHPAETAARARIEELHRDGRGEGKPLPADPGLRLDQHLAGGGNELVDQLFSGRVDHRFRATTTRAGHARGGTEQPAYHRPLFIHRAAVGAQVHAVQALQSSVLLRLGLARQAGHFLRRGGDRAAAVMAAGLALE